VFLNQIARVLYNLFITDKHTQKMKLSTLRKVIITFNQMMKYAVRHRYINYNPVRGAERPRGKGEDTNQIRILIPEEIKALLDAEDDQKYRTLFKPAIMSGAHQVEIIGLKWSGVDWFNNQIHIQSAYNHGK